MAEDVITSGKVIKKPDIVLETDDFLPPGILDVRTKTRDEAGLLEGAGSDSSDTLVGDPDGEEKEGTAPTGPKDPDAPLYSDTPGSMPVPNDMRIISQTVKVGDDRSITIDVVIETSDFPGITEFEVRITKSQL